MLEGEHGRQRKEVRKLVHWLASEARPDIVHLSNAMLLGMAREIRKLGVPVVCSLSGEDIFLEKLSEPFYSRARAALRERAAEVEVFVALNNYYADFMADYMAVPRARIHVIPHGINLDGHATRQDATDQPFTIGYMARICPEKGLHNLIAAIELLRDDESLPPFRVRAAGYLGALDRPYLETVQKQVDRWNDPDAFQYLGELTRGEKIAFLQSLNVMSLPTVYHESKGLSVIEAWANALCVVLPRHGAFPEMVEQTAGGVLHEPGNPAALAKVLAHLLRNPGLATELGLRGRQGVLQHFTAPLMAQKTRELHQQVCAQRVRS